MKRSRVSSVFGQDLEELCVGGKIPVFHDCVSYLVRARLGERAAFCVPGLFETPFTDRKVQLLRQAYVLGRNPLRMLTLQDPRSVAGLLKAWLHELREPLIRTDLYNIILQTQEHDLETDRLTALQAVLRQNDLYRLKILVPLLELLHHHTINQDNIQETASLVGQTFAPYLLRTCGCSAKEAQQDSLAVAAATAMVLDYRSLLSHAMLDTDRQTSHHMLTPRGIDIPKQRPTSIHAAASYPMPTPPRLTSASLQYVSSRSEDVCKLGSGSNPTGAPAWNSITMSDDLDSAFSGSSLFSTWSQDELRRFFEDEEVDNDLVAAVDNLFCASTAGLLIPI